MPKPQSFCEEICSMLCWKPHGVGLFCVLFHCYEELIGSCCWLQIWSNADELIIWPLHKKIQYTTGWLQCFILLDIHIVLLTKWLMENLYCHTERIRIFEIQVKKYAQKLTVITYCYRVGFKTGTQLPLLSTQTHESVPIPGCPVLSQYPMFLLQTVLFCAIAIHIFVNYGCALCELKWANCRLMLN
jgi:hypothetical protein